MTYKQALAYLAGLGKFGMNFGLERIEQLLAGLGHPERRFKIIHIAGSNGKGSTSAMLAAILQASGIKTALYTSPHLCDYTERMVIDNQQIGKRAFAKVIAQTAVVVADMVAAGSEHPTEFEVLTAAAFTYFATAGVEYAVIEAGLGGLLDSTNVVLPDVAVITNVSLEHTDRCGTTIAAIAAHKAGIIKHKVPVVTAAQGDALAVIREEAAAKGAPLYVLGQDFHAVAAGWEDGRQRMEMTTESRGHLGPFTLNLRGCYQVENAALAVMAAQLLAVSQPRITVAVIGQGLATVYWPGRFEVIPGQPAIILDGAHNPDGSRVLREALDDLFPGKVITFVLGILADKDVAGIVGSLVRAEDTVVTVRPISDRAADPRTMAGYFPDRQLVFAEDIAAGINKARALAGSQGVVCIAGSLYLIGPAREIIVRRQKNLAKI